VTGDRTVADDATRRLSHPVYPLDFFRNIISASWTLLIVPQVIYTASFPSRPFLESVSRSPARAAADLTLDNQLNRTSWLPKAGSATP